MKEILIENKKVRFMFHKPAEFIACIMSVVAGKDLLKFFKEMYDIAIEDDYVNFIKHINKNTSQYIKKELKYFFPVYDNLELDLYFSVGLLIYQWAMIKNPNVDTVEGIIKIIENTKEEEIFINVLSNLLYQYEDRLLEEDYNLYDIQNSIEKMLQIVKTINFKDDEKRERIIEYFENPVETKQRYILMLKSIYDRAYKFIEDENEAKVEQYVAMYANEFNNNPEKFCRDYLKFDYNLFTKNINIHVSYFHYMGAYITQNLLSSSDVWIWFGAFEYKLIKEELKKKKAYKFLKTISDGTRLEIIELLSQRPWYVNELADKLNISAASVSYHISNLIMFDIVTLEKADRRAYYSLNKNKLKELFEETMKTMLGE